VLAKEAVWLAQKGSEVHNVAKEVCCDLMQKMAKEKADLEERVRNMPDDGKAQAMNAAIAEPKGCKDPSPSGSSSSSNSMEPEAQPVDADDDEAEHADNEDEADEEE